MKHFFILFYFIKLYQYDREERREEREEKKREEEKEIKRV